MGLQLALHKQVTKVVLETDNTRVVAKLSRDEKDRSVLGPFLEKIKSLL
jgi:hypothetical protein